MTDDLELWRDWLRLKREYELLYCAVSEIRLPPGHIIFTAFYIERKASNFHQLRMATRPPVVWADDRNIESADRLEARLRPRLAEQRAARLAAICAAELPRKKREMRALERAVEEVEHRIEFSKSATPVAIAARAHVALEDEITDGHKTSFGAWGLRSVIRALLPSLPDEMAAVVRKLTEDERFSAVSVMSNGAQAALH